MTHGEDLPPQRPRVCVPGNNASCVVERLGFTREFVLYLVFVFGMLVTILGNFVVIVSVCHFKQLHNPTNVLILSLAVVDFLMGVLVMPFKVVETVYGCWYFGDALCSVHTSFEMFLAMLSTFHLICIAVDRYQAICNPLLYSRIITMSVAVIMVWVIWTLAAVFAFGVIHSKAHQAGIVELIEAIKCPGVCFRYTTINFAISWSLLAFFFPCTVMVCLYAQIFFVARKHVKKIGDKSKSSNDRGRGGLIKQSENKAAKTLSIVLGAFIFCFTPFNLTYLFSIRISVTLAEFFNLLGDFNSALNPIIYALFYPSFKKCFHSIITLKIFSSNSSTMDLSVK